MVDELRCKMCNAMQWTIEQTTEAMTGALLTVVEGQ